ncbi:unnamed protein product [Durusdinium trenchii]|uniref:Uncharacterized protein n=1 Tax=Durusdinium trenchii TaxID=1381693 RepID=A0ABP0RIF0_9DINO
MSATLRKSAHVGRRSQVRAYLQQQRWETSTVGHIPGTMRSSCGRPVLWVMCSTSRPKPKASVPPAWGASWVT